MIYGSSTRYSSPHYRIDGGSPTHDDKDYYSPSASDTRGRSSRYYPSSPCRSDHSTYAGGRDVYRSRDHGGRPYDITRSPSVATNDLHGMIDQALGGGGRGGHDIPPPPPPPPAPPRSSARQMRSPSPSSRMQRGRYDGDFYDDETYVPNDHLGNKEDHYRPPARDHQVFPTRESDRFDRREYSSRHNDGHHVSRDWSPRQERNVDYQASRRLSFERGDREAPYSRRYEHSRSKYYAPSHPEHRSNFRPDYRSDDRFHQRDADYMPEYESTTYHKSNHGSDNRGPSLNPDFDRPAYRSDDNRHERYFHERTTIPDYREHYRETARGENRYDRRRESIDEYNYNSSHNRDHRIIGESENNRHVDSRHSYHYGSHNRRSTSLPPPQRSFGVENRGSITPTQDLHVHSRELVNDPNDLIMKGDNVTSLPFGSTINITVIGDHPYKNMPSSPRQTSLYSTRSIY